MSKKRTASTSGFEEVEDSIQDELFDVLYRTGNSSHFNKVLDMFKKPFHVQSLLTGFQIRLADLTDIFSESTNFGYMGGFIHFDDVLVVSGASRVSGMRRFHSLLDEVKNINGECKYHLGALCNMIEQNVGFLLYLSWLELHDNLEEKAIDNTTEDFAAETLMPIEKEGEEEEEEHSFEANEESALVENLTQQSSGQKQ